MRMDGGRGSRNAKSDGNQWREFEFYQLRFFSRKVFDVCYSSFEIYCTSRTYDKRSRIGCAMN